MNKIHGHSDLNEREILRVFCFSFLCVCMNCLFEIVEIVCSIFELRLDCAVNVSACILVNLIIFCSDRRRNL